MERQRNFRGIYCLVVLPPWRWEEQVPPDQWCYPPNMLHCMQKGCNLKTQAEHSTLLVCGTVVLLGEYFLTFRMIVVPSSSGSSSLDPLKGQEALAQWHSTISHNTWCSAVLQWELEISHNLWSLKQIQVLTGFILYKMYFPVMYVALLMMWDNAPNVKGN